MATDRRSLTALRKGVNPLVQSRSAELGCALGVESFDTFAEIVGLAQPAVVKSFELNRSGERRILGIVEELFGCALGERRESPQLLDKRVDSGFELVVGDAVGCDAPLQRLAAGYAL